MVTDAIDGLSVQDLERTLVELATRKSALERERGLYRRLGFSTERINLALRQVDGRRTQHQQMLRLRQGKSRGAPTQLRGAHLETPQPS